MDFAYFVCSTDAGEVGLIARRAIGAPWIIQQLTHEGAWIDAPRLLPRFWDTGYLEPVTVAEAQAAAATLAIPWPLLPEDPGKLTGYIDIDSDDSFLDLPETRYQPDGKTISGARIDELLEQAGRGQVVLPKLPPLDPDPDPSFASPRRPAVA